jgi:hypothetical protein
MTSDAIAGSNGIPVIATARSEAGSNPDWLREIVPGTV